MLMAHGVGNDRLRVCGLVQLRCPHAATACARRLVRHQRGAAAGTLRVLNESLTFEADHADMEAC
jgi:hypothetical protein